MSATATLTLKLINDALLLPDLARLTYSYFASGSTDPYELAVNGEWEAAVAIATDSNTMLRGACHGGHIELARLMISKGAND